MSALTFTLRQRPAQPVDLAPLVSHRLQDLKPKEIAALPLASGNRVLRVDELFDVAGNDPNDIHIEGSCDRLENIGCRMEGGRITVTGDAGDHLGRQMRGGEIHVQGSVGHWMAAEMHSGRIEVEGNAGDFIGAALPGERKGMHGGIVLVRGDAGHRLGDHMRRGVIYIKGDIGDYCGARMGGGNIIVLGKAGAFMGFGMKRGTLLLSQPPTQLPVTFNDSGVYELLFLRLLFQELMQLQLDEQISQVASAFRRVRRYVGDIGSGGKGEVLIREL